MRNSVLSAAHILILVLMDNQNTTLDELKKNGISILILVLMDNQNTKNETTLSEDGVS